MTTPPESNTPESVDNLATPLRQEIMSEAFRSYQEQSDALLTPEEKIAHGLQFMRSSISQEGTPRFREFWEARRQLLPLFRQNLNSAIRSTLWNEYVELTVEARRLKEILEEQSVFAMEQIDLAIEALEQDVARLDSLVENSPLAEMPQEARSIEKRAPEYSRVQSELNFLNTLASKLNGLRKEIVKTEMRIRFKTKFFKRLSALGDRIFPRRKELIDQVSEWFSQDIDSFVASYFQGEEVVGAPYYALREEIKALQRVAKLLTLTPQTFTKTRLDLSACWDKIKVLERVHKQELHQKKQVWTDNRTILQTKVDELKQRAGEMGLPQLDEAIEEIQREIRSSELGRDDVRYFRQEFQDMRAPFVAQEEEKRQAAQQGERDRQQQKRDKTLSLEEQILRMQKNVDSPVEDLISEFDQIRSGIEGLGLGKFEQQRFERLLKPVRDLIAERKESALLNLSDDQKRTLEQLREVLQQRKQRRQEIKEQLEAYRKQLAHSGLDFEKAILYREQMDLEKERLEKVNASIVEVEQKVSEIEDSV